LQPAHALVLGSLASFSAWRPVGVLVSRPMADDISNTLVAMASQKI